MKFLVAILLFACTSIAQAKTAEINCQLKVYQCTNSYNGLICRWHVLNGEPLVRLRLHPGERDGIWRGTYVRDVDGHRLTLDLRFEEVWTLDGYLETNFSTNAELSTPQVSASSSGTDRIDVGLHNWNYGRGFLCRSIRVL